MSLNNIINRNFSGINVFNISIVEETEPKDYQNRFFMFIKAIPSIKSENSPTGRTYDNSSSVTFKIEAEKGLALSFALLQNANGRGKAYEDGFGHFMIYADMSKSTFGGNGGGKKSLTVKMGTGKDNKANVNMLFSQEGGKPVGFFLTPYEAYSMSKVIEFLSLKCIEFELQGPGIIVKRQIPQQNNFKQKPSKQNDVYGGPTAPLNESNGIIKVAKDFGNIFNGSDDPFSGM